MKRIFSLLILLLFFAAPVFSQLSITQTGTASVLAQQIAGAGVSVSNATLNCGPQAAGTFTYTGADLGIPDGILLTNGIASQVSATFGSFFLNVTNGNNFTDPDLTAISPQATYDACILQFDFVAICDSMKLSFVFGSDEYPKYINQFNDAFGVFITGPKPAGGAYTAQDIATLPSGTPVEINTVNGGWPLGTGATNPSFYIDNYPPDGTNTHNIDYYGYTVPLTSVTPLVPCSSYHMKIAVADAANGHNDSGVFIKGNSVSCQSGAPAVTATGISTAICGNKASAYATVTGNSGPAPTYAWTPGGMTTDTIHNLGPGTYTCNVVFVGACGTYTQTVTTSVTNGSGVSSSATADSTSGLAAFNAQFTSASSASATSWSWTFGDGTTGTGPNPDHIYNTAGTYTAVLTVNGASGCSVTDTVIIHVREPGSSMTVPNVFTPNGDGKNDVFSVISQGITKFDMKIYDRWGILMSEATSPIQGWDGHDKSGIAVVDGTYYYIITGTGVDGKAYKYNGFLTLIR